MDDVVLFHAEYGFLIFYNITFLRNNLQRFQYPLHSLKECLSVQ